LTEGTTPGAPEFSEAEIRAAVEEAALYDTHVAAHAHGPEGIKRAVRAGVRSIEHGSLMDDESIDMMASTGTYLVADVYFGDWIEEEGRRAGWSKASSETRRRRGAARASRRRSRPAWLVRNGQRGYPHAWVGRQFAYMVGAARPRRGVRSATLIGGADGWTRSA
jgi:hypothetical protein